MDVDKAMERLKPAKQWVKGDFLKKSRKNGVFFKQESFDCCGLPVLKNCFRYSYFRRYSLYR